MKKGIKRLVATVMSFVIVTASLCTASVNGATKVYKTVNVVSTTTSSKNISQLTSGDAYQVRDGIISISDNSVNRMASEHFQIIWGNSNSSNTTVNDDFIKGNLTNLENIRTFYIEQLGMKDICYSMTNSLSVKYKTNLYVSNTGLSGFEDDWAYMSTDSEGFAYLFLNPDAMRVDPPSWVIPHELAHAFTYHQGGTIDGAWYESTANWFRDQYLGSEYYAYNGTTYGPDSDFFSPYMLYGDYYVPHMLNWYDTWPIFLYITENPDNINGLGLSFMQKFFSDAGSYSSMYEKIERLSGVSIKTILGGMTKRLATMDFNRQSHYLEELNNSLNADSGNYAKIYTTLGNVDSSGYQSVSASDAPMQTGFNIIPLDLSQYNGRITADFVSTSSASGADFRTSIVTMNSSNVTRYSNMISGNGSGSITLYGDETQAYLVVCATPDTLKGYQVDWNSSADDTDTRYTYKVKLSSENAEVTTETTTAATELSALPAGTYNYSSILTDTSKFVVSGSSSTTQIKIKDNGYVEFKVNDNANVTINYKCGSTNSSKTGAVSLNGQTSAYLAGGDSATDFTVSNLSAGTYRITGLQTGGTTAQIVSVTISYGKLTTTEATTETTTKVTTTQTTTRETTTQTTTRETTTEATTQSPNYTVNVGSATVQVGNTVEIPVTVSGDVDCYSAVVNYDTNKLELVSVTSGVADSGIELAYNDANGSVSISATNANHISTPTLFKLNFVAKTQGSAYVGLYFTELVDFGNRDITATVNPGYVTVEESPSLVTKLGDVDKDGDVDDADASLLLKHLLGTNIITDSVALANADCDGISGVDMRDVIWILNNKTNQSANTTTEATTETTTQAPVNRTPILAGTYSASDVLNNSNFIVSGSTATDQIKIDENGYVDFAVNDNATVTITFKCGSSNADKSASISFYTYTSDAVSGGAGTSTLVAPNMSSGYYRIFASQTGGTTAQIISISVSYDSLATTESTTELTTQAPAAGESYVHNFDNGKNSDFFTISGNLSTSKGSAEYNNMEINQCLKMESSTSITFTANSNGKLTLVFGSSETNKRVKVDGSVYNTNSNGVLTLDLEKGSHTITKGDAINLFYMSFNS